MGDKSPGYADGFLLAGVLKTGGLGARRYSRSDWKKSSGLRRGGASWDVVGAPVGAYNGCHHVVGDNVNALATAQAGSGWTKRCGPRRLPSRLSKSGHTCGGGDVVVPSNDIGALKVCLRNSSDIAAFNLTPPRPAPFLGLSGAWGGSLT